MTLEETIADVRRAVDSLRPLLPKPVVDMLDEKVNTLAAEAVDRTERLLYAQNLQEEQNRRLVRASYPSPSQVAERNTHRKAGWERPIPDESGGSS